MKGPKETGHHDTKGIPICVGDLIRVKHFRHYRRKQQMWLYFRVAELDGKFVVYHWGRFDKRQCLLEDCGIESAEVLTGEIHRNERGELMMWNERKRHAKGMETETRSETMQPRTVQTTSDPR